MTCLEIPTGTLREGSIPVLETERLILRAPRLGDAKAVAALANDRRIAENTRTHSASLYPLADAEDFIASLTNGGEMAFLITLADDTLIGACGSCRRTSRAGDRLLARRQALGQGLRHRGGARADRLRLHRARHTRRCRPARASPIRPRAACWRSAASSGPASASAASARCIRSAPIDRFRLDRGLWPSLKSWGAVRRTA